MPYLVMLFTSRHDLLATWNPFNVHAVLHTQHFIYTIEDVREYYINKCTGFKLTFGFQLLNVQCNNRMVFTT